VRKNGLGIVGRGSAALSALLLSSETQPPRKVILLALVMKET
jgi:hypothetical protein